MNKFLSVLLIFFLNSCSSLEEEKGGIYVQMQYSPRDDLVKIEVKGFAKTPECNGRGAEADFISSNGKTFRVDKSIFYITPALWEIEYSAYGENLNGSKCEEYFVWVIHESLTVTKSFQLDKSYVLYLNKNNRAEFVETAI
jgi:hypothetical protein